MKRSSGPRKTANLSESIHQQLNMYALAASAAGVALLAAAQPANAKIVYTPAHKRLANHKLFDLDLNHDGINDFQFLLSFSTHRTSGNTFWGRLLTVEGARQNNEILAKGLCVAPVYAGKPIGGKQPFQQGVHEMFHSSTSRSSSVHVCTWPGKQAYVGLKFLVEGKIHFGWARFATNVVFKGQASAELIGYAYETIPGKAILAGATKGPDDPEPTASVNPLAPEPATLGALALGTHGLSIWRRKEPALQGN
jgi:hypothetical protein